MDPQTQETVRAAQEAVQRLIDASVKNGPLYRTASKETAHVSRTGKWLLNAVNALQQATNAAPQHDKSK